MLRVICLAKTLKKTQNVLWTCLRVFLRSDRIEIWSTQRKLLGATRNDSLTLFILLATKARTDGCIRKLQYSSQILKHLCDFLLPQIWFGYYSRLSAPKYAWLNIWEGKEHIWVRIKVWRVNVRNLEKIQEKRLLFQRFVTSIVQTETYRSLP